MPFNSIDFAFFVICVFSVYWFACFSKVNLQNAVILIASFIFYGWWDYRFLSLILLSIAVDFFAAKSIFTSRTLLKKKIWLVFSLTVNLGLLGFFKYWNFFVDSWVSAWADAGITMNPWSMSIILPIGISFYTFQTLSYTIDVYRGKLQPAKDFIQFASYVSFFPQLVAGPIERAVNLLPQFQKARKFDYHLASDGIRQILWGLFKKCVIADNCAYYVNHIFEDYQVLPAPYLMTGAVLFAFQIYGDFSGYSDIAIGTAKLFGFQLMTNFRYPYFSRNMVEFWKRWHISLSSWFKDYVYIPLGGSRISKLITVRNIFAVFLLSGIWHGANWTFIVWGLLHALYFIPFSLLKTKQIGKSEGFFWRIKELCMTIITFGFTCCAWVYFRSETVSKANNILYRIISFDLTHPAPSHEAMSLILFFMLTIFISIEWFGRKKAIPILTDYPLVNRSLYLFCGLSIFILSYKDPVSFIYFQF